MPNQSCDKTPAGQAIGTCRLNSTDDAGSVLLLFGFFLVTFITVTAIAIDVGFGYWERRELIHGLDAGALAAAKKIIDGEVPAEILQEAYDIAAINGVSAAEIDALGGIQLGQWQWSSDQGTFIEGAQPFDAVRVRGLRIIPTAFAVVIGQNLLQVHGDSVAAVSGTGSAVCLPPFGLARAVVDPLTFGDTFEVQRNSPGNWGKIDLTGDLNGEKEFRDAIRDGVCGVTVNVGAQFNPQTGFSGVDDGFDERLETQPLVLLPVVQEFPSGNSGTITVIGFVYTKVLATSGSGNNWRMTLELIDEVGGFKGGGPDNEPYQRTRVLVR